MVTSFGDTNKPDFFSFLILYVGVARDCRRTNRAWSVFDTIVLSDALFSAPSTFIVHIKNGHHIST